MVTPCQLTPKTVDLVDAFSSGLGLADREQPHLPRASGAADPLGASPSPGRWREARESRRITRAQRGNTKIGTWALPLARDLDILKRSGAEYATLSVASFEMAEGGESKYKMNHMIMRISIAYMRLARQATTSNEASQRAP
eukprot:scaffold114_cov361-Pinguiococcus_pyrenoidosus.AAC.30